MRATVACFAVLLMAPTLVAQTTGRASGAEGAIAAVIKQYADGLNGAGNLELVLKSFEPDGMWMPPNQPAVKGEQDLRRWYLNYWRQTVAKLQFTPELIRTEGRLAYAQVHVTGTTTSKAGGSVREQDNKALFVLRQSSDGSWKIAHYAINSNKPLPTP